MRITFLMAGGFGLSGGDRVVAIYAEKLRLRGHDVFVVAQPLRPPTLTEQAKSVLKRRGLIAQPVHGPSHFDKTSVRRTRLESFRPITDQDVPDGDVVISTWWETAEWVSRLSSSKGAKVSFLQHYEAFDYTPKDRVDATWRLPFHRITISKWLVDLARERFGDTTLSLIFNSVDTDQFHAEPRTKRPAPTIGMLYSTVPWKNVALGLQAVARVKEKLGPVKVVAFGSGAKQPEPPCLLPEGSEYFYNPPQDEIRDLYARCDAWLCPSNGEGFHLPPLEAMACRCPVVSTAVGGPIDIIRDGENGYLVPVGDVEALANRLHQVLSLPEPEWRRMSDAALATATGYTWDDATDLFERALETAIARRKKGEIQ